MWNKLLTAILLIILVVSVGWMVNQKDKPQEIKQAENKILATIYKDPYCGCCGKWGSYMETNGYETEEVLEDDMSKIKEQFGVPQELQSCHTSEIDGYVVEGHIPNEAVEKLLEERPDIKGIGMAGMPNGSPGMPGPKADFLIYEINHDGTKGDLFMKL
jgi:hypothetical protein